MNDLDNSLFDHEFHKLHQTQFKEAIRQRNELQAENQQFRETIISQESELTRDRITIEHLRNQPPTTHNAELAEQLLQTIQQLIDTKRQLTKSQEVLTNLHKTATNNTTSHNAVVTILRRQRTELEVAIEQQATDNIRLHRLLDATYQSITTLEVERTNLEVERDEWKDKYLHTLQDKHNDPPSA